MYWFVRGRIYSEARHPVSRILYFFYTPVLNWALRWRWAVIIAMVVILALTAVPLQRIGSEFMPPLWEGDLLYMPTTFPGISITKAKEILQQTDKIIRSFPEVESVLGKVGRAETATDPAPLSMIETTITLKDPAEWRPGMTPEKLVEELDRAVQFPGLTNSWIPPIKTRIDMLSTGIKTPVGIKIGGPDLEVLERLAEEVEAVVKPLPGTLSAFAERVMGGTYLDFDIDREAAARFGLTVGDVQDVIQSAVGGMNVSWTVEGLERYPINVRYPRELRDNPNALAEILVVTPIGAQVPLGQLATLEIRQGPPAIKSENARPNAWLYVDLRGIDAGHRSDHTVFDLLHPLLSSQVDSQDGHRALGYSVLAGGLGLAALSARLQLVGGRLGRSDRTSRSGGGDRGGDAAVFGSRLRGLEEAGSDGVLQRSARSRRPRRGQEDPAQDDDRDGHLLLPGTHSVGDRGRFGCHAPHRRPHGRWHLYLLCGRAVGLPGDLLHLAWDRPGAHTPFSIGRRNKRSNE
jgi:hypothetical protein